MQMRHIAVACSDLVKFALFSPLFNLFSMHKLTPERLKLDIWIFTIVSVVFQLILALFMMFRHILFILPCSRIFN